MPAPDAAPEALKVRVRRLLIAPTTDAAVFVLVVISVLLLVPEMLLRPRHPAQVLAAQAGRLLTLVFVVELSVRFWVAPVKRRFFVRYWPDLLAILPIIRPIRLFRVLRVLRLLRAGALLSNHRPWRSNPAEAAALRLMALAAATAALVLGATSVLRTLEPDSLGRHQDALWFSIYSIIAAEPTGANPRTTLGHLVVLGLMLGGTTVFALFVATLSATMVDTFSRGLLMRDVEIDELQGHTVVFGWNGSGATLLRELFHGQDGLTTAVVLVTEGDLPPDLPDSILPARRFFHHRGDYTRIDVLESVGIKRASTAILLTDTTVPRSDQDRDARTVLAALTMERMTKNLYTVAEVTSRQSEGLLSMAGVEEVVVGDWYAGVIMGSASRNRGLVAVLDEVLSYSEGNGFHTFDVPAALLGQTVHQVRQLLHDRHDATLIALHRGKDALVNPPGHTELRAGDQLVVLALQMPRV